MIVVPFSFISRMMRKSTSTSRSVRGAVGSSMMTSLAFFETVFAISTSCRYAVERFRTRVFAFSPSTLNWSRISCAFRFISFSFWKIPGVSFCPRKRFSAMLSVGQRLNSW